MSAAGSPIRMSAAGWKPAISRRFGSAAEQPPVEIGGQPPILAHSRAVAGGKTADQPPVEIADQPPICLNPPVNS